jgi:hypothetical protein
VNGDPGAAFDERRRTGGNGSDRRPIPDPTELTNERIDREVTALRELVALRISGVREVTDEKLKRIDQELDRVEAARIEQKQDTKTAVDAALSAQKEAVREQTAASEKSIEKSETATTKLLDQLTNRFQTDNDALRRELSEVKERIGAMEQRKLGASEEKTEKREDRTALYAVIGLAIAVLTYLAARGGF